VCTVHFSLNAKSAASTHIHAGSIFLMIHS
jgi:hypothetical protein